MGMTSNFPRRNFAHGTARRLGVQCSEYGTMAAAHRMNRGVGAGPTGAGGGDRRRDQLIG